MSKAIFVLLFGCSWFTTIGQRYYVKQYRVEQGLPSDIIKGCTQDSLGFFWIATDEGLVKYDGINFTPYRHAVHSNYTKGFLNTRRGRLLAFGDLDLLEIDNQGDTVIFSPVCPVGRIANDSTLSYPKLLYEDSQSTVWVSESQAVAKLDNGSFKRYEFGLANRTPQFLRSFSFFEDLHHTLYVCSFQGNVFRYDRQNDKFETVDDRFPANVEFVSVAGDRIYIGSFEGVSVATLLQNGGFTTPILTIKIPNVSYIQSMPGGRYLIATRDSEHYLADLDKKTYEALPHTISNVNHVFRSAENDLWLSGNDGLMLMKENLFQGINQNARDFIESIEEDPSTGSIYYALSHTLFSYDPVTKTNKELLKFPSGYFQSLVASRDGLWITNAFKVLLYSGGKIRKEFDFADSGRFVTATTRDSQGNIWLAAPGRSHAFMIDTAQSLHAISVPLGSGGVINMVREGSDGIYIASAGAGSYLFYKSRSDTTFRNVSVPADFINVPDFNVTNFTSTGKTLWLASSAGLLKFDNRTLTRVDLGEKYRLHPVKSVHRYGENKLLVANAFGLLLLDIASGDCEVFNETAGLLSRTITPQGLFVDHHQNVWVGTSRGLCYASLPFSKMNKTISPQITMVSVNGKKVPGRVPVILDYGSFLVAEFSSITFPENEVTFRYRYSQDGPWLATTRHDINLHAVRPGDYTLEVIAKKNGPYTWSDPAFLKLTILRPFWQRGWFYLACFIGTALLVAGTTLGVSARNKKVNEKLQAIIDEKTRDLRKRNEELVTLNQEKSNLVSIVAHDLRSPLNQIRGILSLIRMKGKVDLGTAEHLELIETSTTRLSDLIAKILDVDAIESKKLNLNMGLLNLSEVFNNVADRYQIDSLKKGITIYREIDQNIHVFADRNYLEQVLDNLLSNAVKFSPLNRSVHLCLRTNDQKAICGIRDEGPGLTDEDKAKLFGKYQKLSARPTSNEISTGLGLSIVKRFVGAMNGEIWCESQPGKGASFFVSLKMP